jgi:hypothetical protein
MNSQEDIKIEENKTKGKWGGRRPNSGRPKRMDEEEIIRKLQPMQEEVFAALREKIEGQLNQVSVEVVRPEIAKEEVMCN